MDQDDSVRVHQWKEAPNLRFANGNVTVAEKQVNAFSNVDFEA
jgi:hypothetical protein